MPIHLVSHRRIRAASALILALGLGLAAPIGLAATAGATTPSATAALDAAGQVVVYKAAPGQVNKVKVVYSSTHDSQHAYTTFTIDDSVPITIGTGCTYAVTTDNTKVVCSAPTTERETPYAALAMSLGDRNDTVIVNNPLKENYYFASIDLGAGNDTETDTGKTDADTITGGAGNDTITAFGDAFVNGGAGNDTIHATVGEAWVQGGAGNDVIFGGNLQQVLEGNDGNDTIHAGAGNDDVYGGKGNDVLYGNSGDDNLYGNSGNDTLYGGAGKDVLLGGPGKDVVHQS